MDRIILRTLTLKSKLGFGTDEDMTVIEAIELGQEAKLIDAYYNFSKINFSSEVLAKLGIAEENWIDKPGKDEELGKSVLKSMGISKGMAKKNIRDRLLLQHAEKTAKRNMN